MERVIELLKKAKQGDKKSRDMLEYCPALRVKRL